MKLGDNVVFIHNHPDFKVLNNGNPFAAAVITTPWGTSANIRVFTDSDANPLNKGSVMAATVGEQVLNGGQFVATHEQLASWGFDLTSYYKMRDAATEAANAKAAKEAEGTNAGSGEAGNATATE